MSSSMLWRRWPSPSVTPNELLEILTAHTAGYYVLPAEPNNEVFPGVYLGDSTTALCLHLLRQLGITHVLNAACGKNRNYGMVNTGPGYYRNAGITFMGIEALDVAVYPLFQHFHAASEFIEEALSSPGGRVLVHCGEGISRSSTLVIAWLMMKRSYPLKEAVRQVVKHRNILPNQGFLLQLCQLHDQIVSGTVPQAKKEVPPPSPRSSSVSPMPDRQSQFLSPYPSLSLFSSSSSPSPLPSSSRELGSSLGAAAAYERRRAPSPSPVFSGAGRSSWSNGWTPPQTSSPSYTRRSPSPSPSRRSNYLNTSPNFSSYSSPAKSYHSPVYTSSSYLSPLSSSTRSPIRLRCQSVDRDFSGGGNSSFSRPLYPSGGSSNLLMSSYLSPRPVHYHFTTTIR